MARLFWSSPQGPAGNQVSLLNAQGQLPVRGEAQLVDPSDVVYPPPGGGLLRVPVGGGPAASLEGLTTGQLVTWDASLGQWVLSVATPSAYCSTSGGSSPVLNPGAFNVSGITVLGNGQLQVNFSVPYPTTNFVVGATVVSSSVRICTCGAKNLGSVVLRSFTTGGASSDPTIGFDLAVFGTG